MTSRRSRSSRSSRRHGDTSGKAKKTFALVRGHGWFVVDKIAGHDYDGQPWFIAPGMGFDVGRLLVYADSADYAMEIAEEKWPERVGDRIPRKEEEEAEASGRGTFFSKGHMWYSSEEIRILTVAQRVAKGVPDVGSEATLTTGEKIRYT